MSEQIQVTRIKPPIEVIDLTNATPPAPRKLKPFERATLSRADYLVLTLKTPMPLEKRIIIQGRCARQEYNALGQYQNEMHWNNHRLKYQAVCDECQSLLVRDCKTYEIICSECGLVHESLIVLQVGETPFEEARKAHRGKRSNKSQFDLWEKESENYQQQGVRSDTDIFVNLSKSDVLNNQTARVLNDIGYTAQDLLDEVGTCTAKRTAFREHWQSLYGENISRQSVDKKVKSYAARHTDFNN